VEKSLTEEMVEMDATEVMENGEKEGPGEDGHLMLGEEMGDEQDAADLRDFDIQEKGLVLPSISYLTTTSTTTTTTSQAEDQSVQGNIQAMEQEQTQQIQEHQQHRDNVSVNGDFRHHMAH